MASKLGPGAKSLARGSTFKLPRHPMKRTRRRRPSDKVRERMAAFKEAVSHDACAGCGGWWQVHCRAHHVVYQQHLKPEHRWDVRNALALCDDCHERHHNGSRRLRFSALTESNLEFAYDVLGDGAESYLDRRYPGRPQRPNSPEQS